MRSFVSIIEGTRTGWPPYHIRMAFWSMRLSPSVSWMIISMCVPMSRRMMPA